MTHLEPRLTVRAVRPLISGLRALGYDAIGLLVEAGLDACLVEDPYA
jgi:hypothetical protein